MGLDAIKIPAIRQFSWRLCVFLSASIVLLVSMPPAAPTQGNVDDAGDLDPTFAGFSYDGITSSGDLRVRAVALQEDGKLVAVGAGPIPAGIDWAPMVSRFYASGSVENFNGGSPILGFYGTAYDVAIQPDGKIILAGVKNNNNGDGSSRFFVARFQSNGILDAGFGVGGVSLVNVSPDADGARSVVLQDDGKIIAAGYADIGGDNDFAVIRLNANGSLDTTFSGDGMVTTGFGGCPGHDSAYDVAIQADDKIVVGGYADSGSVFPCLGESDLGLVRYNSDGSLDNNFSGNGKRRIGFGNDLEGVLALDVDPDNRIVAAGFSGSGSGSELVAVVLLDDGTLDASWNLDGKWSVGIPGDHDSATAVQWQVDGKVLMAGSSDRYGYLLRFDDNGELDSSFTGDGAAQVSEGKTISGMVEQPDGRIVVALWPDALARFLSNGMPDTAGMSMANYYPADERAYAVAVQANGDVVLAGEAESPLVFFKRDVAIIRYKSDGQIDTDFGQDGRAVYELPNDDAGRDIIVQPDGKLLVAGFREQSPDYDFVIWRFDPDGALDTSFGSGGMAQIDFGGDDYGQAIVRQADGKIVIAGFTDVSGSRWLSLARVDAAGDLDQTFGNNGKYSRSIGSGYVSLRNLAQLPGGDLLAVGGHAGDFYALRLTADGDPVASFNGDGYAEYPLSGNDEAWAVDSQSSGRIVIAGGTNGDFMLLLVNSDGSMCLEACGFFEESRIRVDFGYSERAYDVDVQDNNRILVIGGGDATDPAISEFLLARIIYSSFPVTGYKLDVSFNGDGMKRSSFRGRTLARSAVLYYDQIIVAGYADNGHDDDFAVARYLNDSVTVPPTPPGNLPLYFPLLVK